MTTRRANDDNEFSKITADAAPLLESAVVRVEARRHMEECDSINVLRLHLADGRAIDITGAYGGYTGGSCDEYIETLTVSAVKA